MDNLNIIYDIPVQITVVIGKSSMKIKDLLKVGRGAVVELDKRISEPVDVLVNGNIVAKGELMVLDNEKMSVTITELVK